MGLTIITDVAAEPVTLTEAKEHLGVSGSDDDSYIPALITAARHRAELYTQRYIEAQTWDYTLDKFPSREFELPINPITSITSVKYFDSDQVEQTLSSANYELDSTSTVARLRPISSENWPATYDQYNAVTIRIVGGYATTPLAISQAILMIIGTLYNDREDTIVGASVADVGLPSQRLLAPYRINP